ncbi:MAG: hypothetical protein HC878_00180 [Leptolyngbyaceae cyanobacterium SL_5_14]|nr:hypothetical protein [Leptolyngbyaceae cyanobacterium SL_5_14]
MMIQDLVVPRIFMTESGLALKVGGNFIPLSFDQAKSIWVSPSGTFLQLGQMHNELQKIDYPVFMLDLGSELYQFQVDWVDIQDMGEHKAKLRSLLNPPHPELAKFVKPFTAYTPFPAPLYSLVQANAEGKTVALSSQGLATYRIIDIKPVASNYPGARYGMFIDPDHAPKVTLYALTGFAFEGNFLTRK